MIGTKKKPIDAFHSHGERYVSHSTLGLRLG